MTTNNEKGIETKNYERDYSHSHCWNQSKNPTCGQSLESHKQCCLCDLEYKNGYKKNTKGLMETIQQDLDNGKFGMICSNETTFKEYISSKLTSHTIPKESIIEVIKEIEGMKKEEKGHWEIPEEDLPKLRAVNAHNDALDQTLSKLAKLL
jgi:uncharacterized membrane protein